MALRLRHHGPPPPDATVLLHMGAGRIDDIVSAAIRSFDDYAELGYDPGLATASVFAELDGVDRAGRTGGDVRRRVHPAPRQVR